MTRLYATHYQRNRLFFLILLSVVSSNIFPQIITIGNGTITNTTTSYPAPYGNHYWGARHQLFISASEISASGGYTGYISSLAFHVAVAQGTPLKDFTISIGAFNSPVAFPASSLTQVFFDTAYVESSGWNIHVFDTPFHWNGIDNIWIETCFNNTSYTYNALVYQTNYWPEQFAWEYHDDHTNVCSTPGGYTYMRPNIRLEIKHDANDFGVISIDSPQSPTTSSSHIVTIRVANFGDSTHANIPVKYAVNGNWSNPEIIPGPVHPGDTISYDFIVPASLLSMYFADISVAVLLPNDTYSENDTLQKK